MDVECLYLYGIVTGRNQFRFFLVTWGKFVVKEVVTQSESSAVPIKGIEGNRSALPDSGISTCVGASLRW